MGEYNIKEALQGFISKSPIRHGLRAAQIEPIWEELMGKTIARYTDKIEMINHTLFIHTSVGALKNELHFQKAQIIHRVNEALGETIVKEIVIR